MIKTVQLVKQNLLIVYHVMLDIISIKMIMYVIHHVQVIMLELLIKMAFMNVKNV